MPVRELERLDELFFRQLVGRAFDHDDVVLSPDVNQIEIALLALGVRWVGDELAIHTTDAYGADRAGKWDVRNCEGGGGAVDCENIRIVFAIGAEKDGMICVS